MLRTPRPGVASEPLSAVHPLLARALVRWQHAAGPFWPYVCAAPFLGEHAPTAVRVRRRGPDPALQQALRPGEQGSTTFFVDLSPMESLSLAPWLSSRELYVVPAIQRWCVPRAVLPTSPLLSLLVSLSAGVARPKQATGAVILLDGERQGRPGWTGALGSRARALDNRYSYTANLLPPPGFLLRQGCTSVRWVSRSTVARDMQGYVGLLEQADISVTVESVGGIAGI